MARTKKVETGKLYCVYLAYSQREIMGSYYDPEKPEYPREFARVRAFKSKQAQIDCYANTMCPASQLFEANNQKEYIQKVEEFKNNFENPKWVKENIHPYI